MIITLTLDKINISEDNICCTFSDEILEKYYAGRPKRRQRNTYKLYANNRELQLECPVIKNTPQESQVIWPAIKLPYRKYPVHIYLYAAALYLSSDLSMRNVAAKVRSIFGLDKFSHSTISRTIKKLTEIAGDLNQIKSADIPEKDDRFNRDTLVPRRNWDPARQDKYRRLLTILYPVLDQSKAVEYASLLNYRYYNTFNRFMI